MLRHYAQAAETERQQRKALEGLPDLTQLPQTQVKIKTGTDNLSNACFMDGTIRQDMIPCDKNKKARPVLSKKNSDIKPSVRIGNSEKPNVIMGLAAHESFFCWLKAI